MGCIHYIKSDGTEEDRLRDLERLFRFMEMGYQGFYDTSGDGVFIYPPFHFGIAQLRGHRVDYTSGLCLGAGEC